MARLARVVAVGEPHHLTQRGNNRQTTFLDDHDRRTYCRLLAEHAKRAGIRVLGYCLMTNHVHLVAIPERADSFARGLGRAHYLYTRWLHERWGGNGHLWQNRFFSCPLDRDHLWTALRYVDLNPLRAGLAEEAAAYEWSSARAHVERQDPLGLLDGGLWGELCGRQNWREMLGPTRLEEADAMAALRRATMTGRPLGSDSFVKRLEGMFVRKLAPKRTGRESRGQATTFATGSAVRRGWRADAMVALAGDADATADGQALAPETLVPPPPDGATEGESREKVGDRRKSGTEKVGGESRGQATTFATGSAVRRGWRADAIVALAGDADATADGQGLAPETLVPPPPDGATEGVDKPAFELSERDFGLQPHLHPIILPNGLIRVRLRPQVTAADFGNATLYRGRYVPALVTRQVDATYDSCHMAARAAGRRMARQKPRICKKR